MCLSHTNYFVEVTLFNRDFTHRVHRESPVPTVKPNRFILKDKIKFLVIL